MVGVNHSWNLKCLGKWWKVVESGGKSWNLRTLKHWNSMQQYARIMRKWKSWIHLTVIAQHHTASYSIIQHRKSPRPEIFDMLVIYSSIDNDCPNPRAKCDSTRATRGSWTDGGHGLRSTSLAENLGGRKDTQRASRRVQTVGYSMLYFMLYFMLLSRFSITVRIILHLVAAIEPNTWYFPNKALRGAISLPRRCIAFWGGNESLMAWWFSYDSADQWIDSACFRVPFITAPRKMWRAEQLWVAENANCEDHDWVAFIVAFILYI